MAGAELDSKTSSENSTCAKDDQQVNNSRSRRWRIGSRLEARSSARFDGTSNGLSSPGTPSPLANLGQTPSPLVKDFKSGDKVMATWKLNRKYPATVIAFEPEVGLYLVEFYDGVQSKVKPSQIRRMRKEDETNGAKSEEAENSLNKFEDPSEDDLVVKPVTPKGRRERKRKFDVKTLLNLRPGSAASSVPSSPTSPAQNNKKQDDETQNKNQTKKRQRRSDRVQGKTDGDNNPAKQPSEENAKQEVCDSPAVVVANDKPSIVNDKPLVDNDKPVTSIDDTSKPNMDSSNTDVVVSGKRERKKKKFWDEEELTGPSREVKPKTPSQKQVLVLPVKPKRRQSNDTSRDQKVNHHHHHHQGVSEGDAKENGKSTLKYLMFDLAQDPKLIADKMVEGVNIPGPGVPIPIESSRLPQGWEKRCIQRGIGITKGKWDVFIQNSSGKSFRSKTGLQKHLDEMNLPHSVDEFDFSLDDRLKRLRQIWKQYIVNADSDKSNKKSSKKVDSVPAKDVDSANAETDSKVTSRRKSDLSVDLQGDQSPAIGIESETGQGLRCTIEKCGKLFRNDRLLQQHVKHYHPDVFDQFISTASPIGSVPTTPTVSPPSAGPVTHFGLSTPNSIFETSTPQVLSNSHSLAAAFANDKKRKSIFSESESCEPENSLKKRKLSLDCYKSDTATLEQPKKLFQSFDSSRKKTARQFFKKSLSESSNASPIINNNTTEMTSFELAVALGRTRTDSILSVGSGSVALSEDGDQDSNVNKPNPKNLPPTPPTFRMSKRRQAQLVGSTKKNFRHRACLNLGNREDGYFRDESGLLTPDILTPVSGYYPDNAVPGSSYPPSEVDTSVTSEHLTSEEVLHCACGSKEEGGLMIQCDICLCWQHGLCLGIDEEQVPDKHVCQTCKNPRAGRSSSRFSLDYDWLKEGKIPTTRPAVENENAFKNLSDLMADLSNLSMVLHSLRVKLQVASQPGSGKVFMWSSLWDPPPSIKAANKTLTAETLSSFDACDPKRFDSQAVIEKLKFHLGGGDDVFASDHDPSSMNPSSTFTQSNVLTTSHQSGLEHHSHKLWPQYSLTYSGKGAAEDGSALGHKCNNSFRDDDQNSSTPELVPTKDTGQVNGSASEKEEEHFDPGSDEPSTKTEFNCDNPGEGEQPLEDQMETDGDQAFDPTLIPTFSEVAQLLPSVLEAMGSAEDGAAESDLSPTLEEAAIPPQSRNVILEPKRLDRDECRLNLLDHISSVQNEVEARLEAIETAMTKIESGTISVPQARAHLTTLLRDIGTTRNLVWSL